MKIKAPTITIPPKRVYSPSELKDFEKKLQKYYVTKTLETGETVQILDFNELAVAYGAFVKREGSNSQTYYLRAKSDTSPSRYEQLINLIEQWEDSKRGEDWIKEKAIAHQMKSYEQVADLQDGLF